MTIKEIVDLYHREFKAVEIGDAVCAQQLSFGEIEQNKKTALEKMEEFSKEQLIGYILSGGKK